MVAITVILSAVIGSFVLDVGQNVQQTGPLASLAIGDAEEDYVPTRDTGLDDFVRIEHQSGEDLEGDSLRILVRNASSNERIAEYDRGDVTQPDGEAVAVEFLLNGDQLNASDTVMIGDIITVQVDERDNAIGDGRVYSVTVVSMDTNTRVAVGTVEVQ